MEAPGTKVVRVPAEIRVVEKEVPVIQTVEVPKTVTRVVRVPQVVEVPIVRETARPASTPPPETPTSPPTVDTAEAQTQTEWAMAHEVVVLEDSEEEGFTYAAPTDRATSSAGRS